LGCIPAGLEEIYHASDLISLHCPSNEKTKYLINDASLKKMKKGVLLVNSARGDLIKTKDLIAALEKGQVGAVALDVTDPEPLNPDNVMLKMENVIITSHVASASVAAVRKLRTSAANLVAKAVRGEELPNVVNGVRRSHQSPQKE
jgi:phosphoglycerate dehydrogenase-like enzyme